MQAKERLKSPRARLFVALELSDELIDALAAWQSAIVTAGAGELRGSGPETLHVTLAFLGHRSEREIPVVAGVVSQLSADPLGFTLDPQVTPVPRGRPRLYAVGLRDAAAVLKLRSGLVESLRDAVGFEDERREFWPHVTLCRVKSRVKRHKALGAAPNPPLGINGRHSPRAVTLFRSDLRPSGAVHAALESLSLPSE